MKYYWYIFICSTLLRFCSFLIVKSFYYSGYNYSAYLLKWKLKTSTQNSWLLMMHWKLYEVPHHINQFWWFPQAKVEQLQLLHVYQKVQKKKVAVALSMANLTLAGWKNKSTYRWGLWGCRQPREAGERERRGAQEWWPQPPAHLLGR